MLFALASVAVSMVLAFLIFRAHSSMPVVFLTAIAIAPMAVAALKKESLDTSKRNPFFKHERLVLLYAYMFFGLALGFMFFYVVLPDTMVGTFYISQFSVVARPAFTFDTPLFFEILTSNVGLLFGFFVLSLVYGYGSLLLLAWNASVLGVIWGNAIKSLGVGSTQVFLKNAVYIWPYLLPEVSAYFIAAVAGGLVYMNFKKQNPIITRDYTVLMGVALLLIVIGAVIETIVLSIV